MKKTLKIFLVVVMAAGAFQACKPNDGPGTNTVPEEELVLSADKYTVTADGVDAVEFSVKLNGEDVTADCRIYDAEDRPLDGFVFSTVAVGEHRFRACYDEGTPGGYVIYSEEITVTAEKIAVTGQFDPYMAIKKNVAYFAWTAVWSIECYDYLVYMERVVQDFGDDIVQAYFHTDTSNGMDSDTSIRMTLGELAEEGRFDLREIGGYPMSLPDFRENLSPGYVPSEVQIRAAYRKYIENSPKTGVKVSSTITEGVAGSKLDVTVTVGAKEPGNYFLGLVLVEDHVKKWQRGSQPEEQGYDHTNVARHLATALFGDPIGSMALAETVEKEFTFTIADNYKPENLSLVVYTLYNEEGYNVIDNAVKIPANSQADFNYAE
jgi:hypothetical protein